MAKASSKDLSGITFPTPEIQVVPAENGNMQVNQAFSTDTKKENQLSKEEKTYRSYTLLQTKLKGFGSDKEIEAVEKVNCDINPFSLANPVSEIFKVYYVNNVYTYK